MKPRRRICDQLTLFRQLLQWNWYQMYWVSFPLEHTSNAERGILMHGQLRFSISSAQACTLARILKRHIMVSTQHGKQQLPVTSLTANWRRARRQGLLSTVGEILGSHWTATAHLKLGSPSQIGAVSPQFVCLIGCMRHKDNTRQANCNHCTKQHKRKAQSPSTQAGHLECKDHDTWSIR